MFRHLVAVLAFFVVACHCDPPETEPVSTVTGVSVASALVCEAESLDGQSEALLKRWVELNEKSTVGDIEEAEQMEGMTLVRMGVCTSIRGGIKGTVVLLNGTAYLVRYCLVDGKCIKVIQRSEDFIRDE
jgi:hypothetical protein